MTRVVHELVDYRLPLAEPVSNANRVWTTREGVLLRIQAEPGLIGQGEAAPLPGFSPDTLCDCRTTLAALDAHWLGELIECEPAVAFGRIEQRIPDTLPAARCAVETAYLDVVGQRTAQPIWALLRALEGRPASNVTALPLAAVVASDPERWPSAADAAVRRGVRTLKLKIGRPNAFSRELAQLRALRDALPAGVRLRLDANQSWPAERAQEHLAQLAELEPEFVEEPTADWSALAESRAPLAVDESLSKPGLFENALKRREKLRLVVCVLKPTLLGGIARALRLARVAREAGLDAVISHTFEGPVGLRCAQALALAIARPERAMGLDRHAGLAAWPDVAALFSQSELVPDHRPGLGLPLLGAPAP
jgi:o-succinylbenzoate synthase